MRPQYPDALAGSGVGGSVALVGRIGIDGYMSDLREAPPAPGDTAPHPALVKAAVDAVRRWEFQPTWLNGAPVETNIAIAVTFAPR